MAIVRPIAAIISAITAGMLVGRAQDNEDVTKVASIAETDCCSSEKPAVAETTSCCAKEEVIPASVCCEEQKVEVLEASCCSEPVDTTTEIVMESHPISFVHKAWDGIVYSFTDLFDKVLFWLVIGMLFAAAVKTFVPVSFLAEWGSGLPAMLVMLVVGIPMYVCATASTPIAAGLILAGVSPGTAMVFLMAGPATNISTLGVIGKELGKRSLIAYLTGVGVVALLTGFIVDYLVARLGIDVQGQIAHGHEMVPSIIAWASLLILVAVVIKLKAKKLLPLKAQMS
jgi:hypothetical protein